jgi:hypothetical protein
LPLRSAHLVAVRKLLVRSLEFGKMAAATSFLAAATPSIASSRVTKPWLMRGVTVVKWDPKVDELRYW